MYGKGSSVGRGGEGADLAKDFGKSLDELVSEDHSMRRENHYANRRLNSGHHHQH